MSLCFETFNSVFLNKNRFNYKVNYGVVYEVNHGNYGGGNIMQWEFTGSVKAVVTGL